MGAINGAKALKKNEEYRSEPPPEAVRLEGAARSDPARVTPVVHLTYGPEALLLVVVTPPGVRVNGGASLSFNFGGGRLYLFDGEGPRLA